MKILKLNASNINGILSVERACFSSPWTEEMFLGEFENNPAFYCFGAEENGVLAGFLCFWHICDEFHIGNLAVIPEMRRKGIAKKMLEFLIETAKLNEVTGLTLEVRKSNEAAITLYSGFGFRAEGVRPRYYENGEDALVMWRREN